MRFLEIDAGGRLEGAQCRVGGRARASGDHQGAAGGGRDHQGAQGGDRAGTSGDHQEAPGGGRAEASGDQGAAGEEEDGAESRICIYIYRIVHFSKDKNCQVLI